MNPSDPDYHVDWAVSSGDVHIATDIRWFSSFTPFKSFVTGLALKGATETVGVGDVTLKLALPWKSSASSKLVLRDVLYCPGGPCNIMSPYTCAQQVILSPGDQPSGFVYDSKNQPIGVIDRPRLMRLRLHGQTSHQTSLQPNVIHMVSMVWPKDERERWLQYRQKYVEPTVQFQNEEAMSETPGAEDSPEPYIGTAPYSAEELRWIKQYYKNEYSFLRELGLNIHKDEQREEGRAIARCMIAADQGNVLFGPGSQRPPPQHPLLRAAQRLLEMQN